MDLHLEKRKCLDCTTCKKALQNAVSTALIAQDTMRVEGYGPEGREFESSPAHQNVPLRRQ